MAFYWGDASEHKQRINLSLLATSVIENDHKCFESDYTDHSSSNWPSAFINQIIKNFANIAQATIPVALKKKNEEIIEAMRIGKIDVESKQFEIYRQLMIDKYKSDLLRKANSYPRGINKVLYINKVNIEFLVDKNSDCPTSSDYNDHLGHYLKAILEEYCRLHYFERERIYFRKNYDIITDIIKLHRNIKLILDNNRIYNVKPYCLMMDPLGMYNYLVGWKLIIKDGSDIIDYRPISFRLSRIREIRDIFEEPKFFEKEKYYKNEIENELKRKGVQFLASKDELIKIFLSDKGKEIYNKQLHIRPNPIDIEKDKHTYIFNCSTYQIQAYFFKFGEDAEIIEPAFLRNIFKEMYYQAYLKYE